MTTIKINLTTFRALLRATAPAVSKDATRTHLHGVRVQVVDGRVVFDATDGHRLHRASAPWVAFEDGELPPPASAGIIIPGKHLAGVLKAVPAPKRGQAPSLVVLTATGIETDATSVRWSASVNAASFPDADRVIPAPRFAVAVGSQETCAGGWAVQPSYLAEAMEACALVTGTGGATIQTPEDSLSPVRVEATGWVDAAQITVVCVIMPMRL